MENSFHNLSPESSVRIAFTKLMRKLCTCEYMCYQRDRTPVIGDHSLLHEDVLKTEDKSRHTIIDAFSIEIKTAATSLLDAKIV